MRVLHINAVYGTGSTGVIVADIHKKSLQNNIESYVAYAISPISKDKIPNAYKIGSVVDRKVHAVLGRINGKQAYFSKKATGKLLQHMDLLKPDIVHLHNLHSNYVNLNILLKYLAENDISTVITLHDCWFYTGGCFHYTQAGCFKWLEQCKDCPKKGQDTRAYIRDCSNEILEDRRKYFGQISNLTVVGVSEWITNEAAKTFLKNNRIATIYNGVDLDFFKPSESDFRRKNNLENKFLVLGIANKWLKQTNKRALELFVNQLDEDSKFVLIGCSRGQQDSLPKNIMAVPYVKDRYELRNIYSACDVFVNCTWEESLSMVNIEAQSCGTPVVTYANTGVKETVDGESGIRVQTGNAQELFDAVIEIKKNGKAAYSDKCRRFVSEKFNREKEYDKYLKLYSDIFLAKR